MSESAYERNTIQNKIIFKEKMKFSQEFKKKQKKNFNIGGR